jgi:hypothetical protein
VANAAAHRGTAQGLFFFARRWLFLCLNCRWNGAMTFAKAEDSGPEHEPPDQPRQSAPTRAIAGATTNGAHLAHKARGSRIDYLSCENHYGQRKCRKVLLKLDVLVHREKDIELLARLRQQNTVAQSRPAHFIGRADLVSSQQAYETSRNTVIQQHPHWLWTSSSRCRPADSSTDFVCSRVTPGKSSRKVSKESPELK